MPASRSPAIAEILSRAWAIPPFLRLEVGLRTHSLEVSRSAFHEFVTRSHGPGLAEAKQPGMSISIEIYAARGEELKQYRTHYYSQFSSASDQPSTVASGQDIQKAAVADQFRQELSPVASSGEPEISQPDPVGLWLKPGSKSG